jgi:LmbE family N-acetylglucosaminyl deacetylase
LAGEDHSVGVMAPQRDKISLGENQVLKILVFAPHPDDDVIGCGGSIAKYKKNGHNISIVYMTSGESYSFHLLKEKIAHVREFEATAAANILGVKKLYFLRNPDGCLEYNQKIIIQLVKLIRQEQPDIVFVPHRMDKHNDHIITHKLVVDAIKCAASPHFNVCNQKPWSVRTIFCYKVWAPQQEVSYSEDISEFMGLKLQALKKHASQRKPLKRYRDCTKTEEFQVFNVGDNGDFKK